MHVCVLTLYIILVFLFIMSFFSKSCLSSLSIKFFLKSTRPSFFDKAVQMSAMKVHFQIAECSPLFPIKEGSFENPPVLPYP